MMYHKPKRHEGSDGFIRVRMPRGKEVLGIVEANLGASKLKVRCQDDKIRLCRIPGKMRRRIWMDDGSIILVEPWSIQGDSHGDAIWKYTPSQAEWLRRKGILKL